MQIDSFLSGIAHPLSGADHILAMTAVGLWAVLADDRAIWIWPIAFVATMLVGFAAAISGLQIALVQPAISSSIIVFRMLIAFAVTAPVWPGAAIVGLFAFFHGHAHGTEATAVSLFPYAAGFALATAGLYAVGIGFGRLAARTTFDRRLI